VFEDDAKPVADLVSRWTATVASLLFAEWQFLFLGGVIAGRRGAIAPWLIRPASTRLAHAYIVRRSGMALILAAAQTWHFHVDQLFSAMATKGEMDVLSCYPPLFTVRPEASDIREPKTTVGSGT
jgi:hypothetical protein